MGVIENRIDITELERSGGGGGGGTAASVSYDNTSSGLTATTVQGAIDEVVGDIGDKSGKDQISNRNLLDNPFFTVNQRGKTTYNVAGYTVDRWMIAADQDITVSTNGISTGTAAQFHQRIEPALYTGLIGKTVTASVLLSDGTNLNAIGLVTDENDTYVTIDTSDLNVILTKDAYNFFFMVTFKTTTVTVKAVKLEIGSVSTLDMDAAPNYAEELLKCQRYFQRMTVIPGRQYAPIGTGIVASSTGVRLFVPLIASLRTAPTVTFNTDEGKIDLFGANTANRIPVTNIAFNQLGNNSIILTITVESLQSYIEIGDACECWIMGSTDAYIDLSADL